MFGANDMYKKLIKPLLDFLLSLLGFILLLPLFLLISIILFWVNNGSPFFVQPRPGKHGKVFRVIKFKTMTDARNKSGELLPEKDRITAVGRFLRKSSLDEIPQLLNIIKGDMSVVGPRPLRVEYLNYYNEEQARRHDVKPGVTGWAQVNGRNAISWEKKFEYDVYYVDNMSFRFDVKIILKTIKKVFDSSDVNQSDDVPMEKFRGTKQ